MIKLKLLDGVALAVSVAFIALFSWYAYGHVGEKPIVYIQGDKNAWVYPLDSDRDLEIDGPLGKTQVHIKDKTVHVTDSPCRDKVCVYAGTILKKGDWIACLPNRVFIRIESKAEVEVDTTVF